MKIPPAERRFRRCSTTRRQSGAVIYSIGLGGGGGGALKGKLKRLATETGGRFFSVSKASELEGVYAEIERELRSQYFLTFVPAKRERDRSVGSRGAGEGTAA